MNMLSNRTVRLIVGVMALFASLAASASSISIHEIVRGGDVQAVTRWLAANRNMVNIRNELGSIPLHIAANMPTPEIARLLIDHGASVNASDNNGSTPLHIAAFSGHKAIVELLLARGANVHARDGRGKTARDYAETTLNHEIGDFLLIRMLATPRTVDRKQ